MMRYLLAVSVLLLSATWAVAQNYPSQTKSSNTGSQATVEGCLSGSAGSYTQKRYRDNAELLVIQIPRQTLMKTLADEYGVLADPVLEFEPRIVTALSPWLWLAGAAVMFVLLALHPNFLVGLILLLSLPRLWFLFRKKSDEERRYFEVTPGRRLAMAGMYFGLIGALLFGMALTHIAPAS